MMSVTTFHLKGSGWYVTDYGGKKAPPAVEKEKSESPAETAASSEPATGAESKKTD
jgi:predicted nucleic acid-binding Zn ribbon protein